MRLRQLHRLARGVTTIAAAVAAAVSLWAALGAGRPVLAVAVVGALLVRLQGPSDRCQKAGGVLLVLAVAVVVGVAGGPTGPLLVTLLLVIAELGLSHNRDLVALTGILAAFVTAGVTVVTVGVSALQVSWVWALVLVPLVGILASELGDVDALDGTAALESATTALDEVVHLAERMPAGFDRWSVAMAVHLELLDASGTGGREGPGTHLLLVDQGVLFGVGPPFARRPVGLAADLPRPRWLRHWATVDGAALPLPLREPLGGSRWHLHRLDGTGEHGIVLVPASAPTSALAAVEPVLRPAAVALANVGRFERLQELAVSAARVRVAHDLHDGVAQALTHVRFELDLLGLQRTELADDITRIRRVADAALLDVRRTVDELRDAVPFRERLARHVELLTSFVSVSIELDVAPDLEVDDWLADDVFRIVQEALSNALRHAGASAIRVSIEQDQSTLTAIVVDDGRGIAVGTRPGVGLDGMHSRAARLGGDLVVRARHGGGTVVELDVPVAHAGTSQQAPDTIRRSR